MEISNRPRRPVIAVLDCATYGRAMGRIDQIQFLRGFAAIAVLQHHAITGAFRYCGLAGFSTPLEAGVDLFFVISGFIMWVTTGGRATPPASFLWRRALRIVPLYWICTAAAVVLWMRHNSALPPADHLVKSALFIPHFSPEHPDEIWPFLVPGWTLTYEAFFYLIFAASLLAARRYQLAAVTVTLCLLVVIGTLVTPAGAAGLTYTSPLLLEFMAGCVIGRMFERGCLASHRGGVAMIIIGAASLAVSALAIPTSPWSRAAMWGIPVALIVFGALGLKFKGHPRVIQAFGLAGDASYSIYLSHTLLLTLAFKAASLSHLAASPAVAIPFFMVVGSGVAISGGLLLYVDLERPIQRLAHKFRHD